jgi:predicted Ser/Thr protein kinase
VFTNPEAAGEPADIFSLGAIAYHLFSGERPAENQLALHEKLRESDGLRISTVMDGAGESLQQLIAFSTFPNLAARMDSMDDFIEILDAVENDLTRPESEERDPNEARPDDVLPGGYKVTKRLGGGASSNALLIDRDGQESVMKIARTPEDSETLRQEAEVLRKLRDQHFPELRGTQWFGGRLAILMSNAGDKTLAQWLRDQGKLHVDMLERLGEDLLEAIEYLDNEGIQHRDIKPANIGISRDRDRLRLVLFDFSLSAAPFENIRAGTRPYLEPFLAQRKPPRWDQQAERFAGAMTLYEMATGTLPKWGDGQSDADLLDCEATLGTELFEPNLREHLTDFFTRALRRDPNKRFDTAEEMLRAWRAVFAEIDKTTSSSEGDEADQAVLDSALAEATRESPLSALPLSLRAQSVLQRLNLVKVGDLLKMQVFRLYRLPGVGNRTRREIGTVWEALYERLGPRAVETASEQAAESSGAVVRSVDLLAKDITPAYGGNDDKIVAELLDIAHPKAGEVDWPSQNEIASRLGIKRPEVVEILRRLRAKWDRTQSLKVLRQEIRDILERSGGVMNAAVLTRTALALRGSMRLEPLRSAAASAVTRAVVDTRAL